MIGDDDGLRWVDELRKRDSDNSAGVVPEEQLVEKMLDAVAWVKQTAGAQRVTNRLASGALSERVWIKTVVDVVLRVIRNPEGKRSEGDGVYSYDLNPAVASGDMWLTASDLKALLGETVMVPSVIALTPERGWAL